MAAGETPKSIHASLYIDGKPAENSIKGVSQVAQSLRKDLNSLTIGTEEFNAKAEELKKVSKYLADARGEASNLSGAMSEIKESFAGIFESLGIGVGIGELVSFGKELFAVQEKADGIEMAFTKIGNTSGLLEKLRDATHGLIADMDLQKMAVQAQNANIPLDKLGLLLDFAQQRAKDTGQNVTELADRLVKGLSKNNLKAVQDLGLDMVEVKKSFQVTGNMVETVSQIIQRQMAASGEAVDVFSDKTGRAKTKWENFTDFVSKAWKGFFAPEQASPEEVEKQTNAMLSRLGVNDTEDIKKLADDKISAAIIDFQGRVKKLGDAYKKAKADLKKAEESPGSDDTEAGIRDVNHSTDRLKSVAEQYQSVQNVLGALSQEQSRRPKRAKDNSVEGLEEQIKSLKQLQTEVSTTTEDWKKYQDQIDEIEKKRDAITGKKEKANPSAKKEDEKRKAALAAFKQLATEQKQFEAAQLADEQAKNEKEIEMLQNKYNQFIQKEKDFLTKEGATKQQKQQTNQNITRLEIEKTQAVADLKAKQQKDLNDKIAKYLEQQTVKTETELQKQETAIREFFDAQRKDIGNNPAQHLALAVQEAEAITNAKIDEHKRLLAEVKKLNQQYGEITGDDKQTNQVAKINAEADQELAALKKSYSAQEQATQAYADAVAAIMNIKNQKIKKIDDDFNKQWLDAALNAVEEVTNAAFEISEAKRHAQEDAQINQLEKQRTRELSNKNLTESQKAAIDARYNQQEATIKKQAWEADKKASEEQAVINGAVAIVKTFAEYGFTTPGWIAAAAQAVATGVQIATIASQPTPQFADGGFVSKTTLFTNSASGRPFIAGEAGAEWIAPNWMVQSPRYANIIGMLEGARQDKRTFAVGGYNGPAASGPSGATIDTSRLENEMRLTREAIQTQQVVIDWHYWQTQTAKIAQIQQNANAQ